MGTTVSSNLATNSMGIWSHESFGNDDAADWADKLTKTEDFELIESTLAAVLGTKSTESVSELAGLEAIAAAEAIARLQGNVGKRDVYSRPVDEWVARIGLRPSKALCRKTHRALTRILTPSSADLLEGWVNPKTFRAWVKSVRRLKQRIRV